MTFRIHQCDAVQWLSDLVPESIDLIVTDPAYESLEKHRAVGTTTRLKKAWFEIFPNERFPALFAAMYHALKQNSHLYVICDETTADIVKPIGRAAGFTFWKSIVWDKRKIGMGYHYRAKSEWCLFFEKGKRKLHDLGIADVLEGPDCGPDWIKADGIRNGYPTQKPIELLKVLIGQSSDPGSVVADPFGGSFSTGQAAALLGRHFAGCDISKDAVEAGRRKLAETPFLARAS
jgi:site-specific DNA-methyltransferase (adenine-specific)